MHRHSWVEIERIDNIVTLQCEVCPKRRTRVRGPERTATA